MDCEKVVESDFDKILKHLRCLNIHLKMRSEDTVKRYLKFDKYFRLVAFVVLQYGIENPSLFPNARAEGYKSAMRIHLANGSWVFWCGDIDTKSNTYLDSRYWQGGDVQNLCPGHVETRNGMVRYPQD